MSLLVIVLVAVAVGSFCGGAIVGVLQTARHFGRIVDGYVEQNKHCCQAVRAAVTRERQIRQAANQRMNAESKARLS